MGNFFAFIAALCAGIAAVASWRTAKETKNLVLAQIVNDIRDQFDSLEVLKCKEVILEIRIREGDGEIGRYYTKNQKINQGGDQRNREISEFVKIYYNLFHKIKILLDTECIDSGTLRKVILPDELDVFFEIVEPLVKDDLEYDPLIFETYRKIFEYEVTS